MPNPAENFEGYETKQLLPREAYTSQAWYEREMVEIFGNTWSFAGLLSDFKKEGDYVAIQAGPYPLIVLRDKNGDIIARHNLCRHRGAKLLDGAGSCARGIKCKYHYWIYNTDGSLRGVPQQDELFPGLEKGKLGLKPASVGIWQGAVFVHLAAEPEESFSDWLAGIDNVAWGHDLSDLEVQVHARYRLKANWKLAFENAIDGYHLSYLHEKTLAGPVSSEQVTAAYGRHTTYAGTINYYLDLFTKDVPLSKGLQVRQTGIDIPGAETRDYANLYFMFPNVTLAPSPNSFLVLHIIPEAPDSTVMDFKIYAPHENKEMIEEMTSILFPSPELSSTPADGVVTLDLFNEGVMSSKNFQLEDMWICQRMQQAMSSPAYEAGPYGLGNAEGPITYFQQNVLDALSTERSVKKEMVG